MSNKKRTKGSRKKRTSKFNAACLGLGLATTWCGDVEAGSIFKVDVTPTKTLTNAFIEYRTNTSMYRLLSLGTLPGGQTSTFFHDSLPDDFFDPVKSWGYSVVGLFDYPAAPGVAVSFPDDSVIVAGLAWSDIWQNPLFGPHFAEPDVIAALASSSAEDFMYYEYAHNTPIGVQATLADFSTASLGGVALVTIVPEPASWVLIVSAATGLLLLSSRKPFA